MLQNWEIPHIVAELNVSSCTKTSETLQECAMGESVCSLLRINITNLRHRHKIVLLYITVLMGASVKTVLRTALYIPPIKLSRQLQNCLSWGNLQSVNVFRAEFFIFFYIVM